MYPYDLFFGVDLYDICIVVGLLLAMILFRFLADRAELSAKLQNSILVGIPLALFVGYPSAVILQWIYNGIRDGGITGSAFDSSTGATFYGGLIGGAAAFLIFYFVVGHYRLPNKEHLRCFPTILDLGPCCITIAHALGRVGCFFAGCCYGIETDSILGLFFVGHPDARRLPTQIFEAFFLLLLCAFLVLRFLDKKRNNLPIYLIAYGVFRFVLEYLRGDDRGETFVSFLTPSQLTAIVMILVGILLIVFSKKIYENPYFLAACGETSDEIDEGSEEVEENTPEEAASAVGSDHDSEQDTVASDYEDGK